MKKDNYLNEVMFDKLRNTPPEISFKEVTKMVDQFPDEGSLDLPSDTNWSSFLNLKNLIMITIPISITAVIFLALNPIHLSEKENELTLNDKALSNIETEKRMESIEEIPQADNTKTNDIKVSKTTSTTDIISAKKEVIGSQQLKPIGQKPGSSPSKSEIAKTTVAQEDASTNVNTLEKSDFKNDHARKSIDWAPVETDHPNLSDLEIKRLKKSLYKNLLADNIIDSKKDFVEILLDGNQIIINDQKLSNQLLAKYQDLTSKAGTGKDRKIKMTQEYIKVGDFTSDGFKGTGYGTFYSADSEASSSKGSESENKNLKTPLSTKEFIDLEIQKRDQYAKELMRNSSFDIEGKRRNLGINLSQKKMSAFHELLYAELISDQLISSKENFVIIQIAKNGLFLNDQKLENPLLEKYLGIISKYKIKSGINRQVRLSQHTISVGNFGRGQFTGTQLYLDQ